MGDDWKPGDLALCVRVASKREHRLHGHRPGQRKLRKGQVRVVEAVVYVNGVCGLVIEGAHSLQPHRAWHHRAFRKIRPHTPDAEDRETIALLNGTPAPPAPSKPEEVGNV